MTDVAGVPAMVAMAPAMMVAVTGTIVIVDKTTAMALAPEATGETIVAMAGVGARTTRAMAIPHTETLHLATLEGTAEAMLEMMIGMAVAVDGTTLAMEAIRARMAMTGPATPAAVTIMTAGTTATAVVDMTPLATVAAAAAMALRMEMIALYSLAGTVLVAQATPAAVATATGLRGVPDPPISTTMTSTSPALEAVS